MTGIHSNEHPRRVASDTTVGLGGAAAEDPVEADAELARCQELRLTAPSVRE